MEKQTNKPTNLEADFLIGIWGVSETREQEIKGCLDSVSAHFLLSPQIGSPRFSVHMRRNMAAFSPELTDV